MRTFADRKDRAIREISLRNAQNLAAVCAAAQAAGLDFISHDNLKCTIQAIVKGGEVKDRGPFQGVWFGVPNLSEEDQEMAAQFLRVENGMLVYQGDIR